MADYQSSHDDYRGYGFETVHYGAGWRVHITPGAHLLPTEPDHILADTREEALIKARAVVDLRLLGRG